MKRLQVVLTCGTNPYQPIEYEITLDEAMRYLNVGRAKHQHVLPENAFKEYEDIIMRYLHDNTGFMWLYDFAPRYPHQYIRCEDIVFVEFVLVNSDDET